MSEEQNLSEQTATAELQQQQQQQPEQQPEVQEGEEGVDAMKQRLQQLEEEASQLQAMQTSEQEAADKASASLQEPKEDIDARSVYVGNVDYGTTPEELQKHFQSCGTINRVTILTDKYTGHPKGFAYVEFAEPALVVHALVLNESMFRGRALKVTPKRTNVPGMSFRGGRGRGRGGRGRGGRGGYRGGFRGRGRGGFFPY